MRRILLIEDDYALADLVAGILSSFQVTRSATGLEGLKLALVGLPDLIILDLNLPDLDGLNICRQLRQDGVDTPILVLSARQTVPDRVTALDYGADDYVVKPFEASELLARVRALLRRSRRTFGPPGNRLSLDRERRRAALAGRELPLTLHEFNILACLARRPGSVFSRGQILEEAWDRADEREERTVDSHIRNLRGKLRSLGADDLIECVRGVGYRLAQ